MKQGIESKMEMLQSDIENGLESCRIEFKLNELDQLATRIMLRAEDLSSPSSNYNTPWHPALIGAKNRVRYWRTLLQNRTKQLSNNSPNHISDPVHLEMNQGLVRERIQLNRRTL